MRSCGQLQVEKKSGASSRGRVRDVPAAEGLAVALLLVGSLALGLFPGLITASGDAAVEDLGSAARSARVAAGLADQADTPVAVVAEEAVDAR